MRKLKIFQHITLDGVIQHSDENGFRYGDWSSPYRSAEGRNVLLEAQGDKFDLLLGRRTYDIWADYWPKAPSGPMADGINGATKYVATHRPESLDWGPVEAVGPNLTEDIARIKGQEGPDLVMWGSASLASDLLRNDLADELLLIVYPVLLGVGKRLFDGDFIPRAFHLMSSDAFSVGTILNRYELEGGLRTSD